MIHYHGTPLSGDEVTALKFLTGRHAFVSFAAPNQLEIVASVCESFAIDNGAFSAWKAGKPFDFSGYREFAQQWGRHPACDWVIIPDVIDGTEKQNDDLIASWWLPAVQSVPVWHLHESIERLMVLARSFPRVAFGSSGEYAQPGSPSWWGRMVEAMDALCETTGYPPCKLHGLRMLNPEIFRWFPFASADSTNVARNIGIDRKWERGPYQVTSRLLRAEIIAKKVEAVQSARRWEGPPKKIKVSIESCDLFAEIDS